MSEASVESPSDEPTSLWVGGSIETPAYALLDGMLERERVTVPIAKLPALLGRITGDGPDPNAVSSGNTIAIARIKTLSRKHIRIEYRTKEGTFSTDAKAQFVYKAEPMQTPPADQGSEGFYLLTCLGKNPITVNGKTLKQSEHAVLHSGSTIKVHGLRLYFLLPTEASTDTIQVPTSAAAPKRKAPSKTASGPSLLSSPVNTKKPKLAKSAAASIAADKALAAASSAAAGGGGWPTLQSEIDSLKTSQLLKQVTEAIASDTWERRHQLIGSTVSYRAVMEAANDPDLVHIAEEDGSVGRGDIMRWISESPKFGNWVRQMHTKLEEKSYQASITKALVRAGYERTTNTGRYIKWQLPADKDQGIPVDDDNDDNDDNDAEMIGAGSNDSSKIPGPPPLSAAEPSTSPENGQNNASDDSSASGDDGSAKDLINGSDDGDPTE